VRLLKPPPAPPAKWPWLFHGFRWYAPHFARRSFTAVRTSGHPWPTDGAPILAVTNHPSWYDPVVGTALSFGLPTDDQYAAIDAAEYAKNWVFRHIGFVPVELHSVRGAADFLRRAGAILAKPGGVLWVTAQGRFVDVRDRPLNLRPGVGHLAKHMTAGWVIPVAFDYPFWDGRKPEALARVGPPIGATEAPGRPARQWTARIEAALTEVQDALAADARSRDPARFTVLAGPGVTPSTFRDTGRRIIAAVRGRPYYPHPPADRPS